MIRSGPAGHENNDGVDFDGLADDLYGLPPAEFIAARDQWVKQARSSGDRPLADRIRKLRKPTGGAWLANLLVRSQLAEVKELLELGAAMREAQDALAGEQLATLSRQRQLIVNELSRDALRRAHQVGHPMTPAAALELADTLRAALADPSAAEQFRAGRLTTALQPTAGGFEKVPVAVTPAPRKPSDDGLAQQREATDAAIERATDEVSAAERSALLAQEAVQRQQAEAASRQRRLAELEAELSRVRAEEALSLRELRRLQDHLDAAFERAERLRGELSEAQDSRRRLGKR
ncbi:MAG: hypothetical protein ABJC62_03630 [Frankiaceae bacterium]